jgi:ribosome-associated protein
LIKVNDIITINEKDIREEFIKSSGPGGQNVNKLSTAVKLFYNVKEASIPIDVKARLKDLSGSKMTEEGMLIIHAKRLRSQDQNRKDALSRLKKLLIQACKKPRLRRKTKPTKASVEKRLASKKKRSMVKNLRRLKDNGE